MLAISIRPYYLPREFSHILYNYTVYIPDKSIAKPGSEELSAFIHEVEAPDAFIVVNGDFKYGSLKGTGSQFYQHVKCPTRGEATLDLCYTKVKESYTYTLLNSLGESDHN